MFGRSAARADYIIYAVCAIAAGLTWAARWLERWDDF